MLLVEISLFGVPRVLVQGTPIDFARRKALALLAYLAVTRQSHSRDTLATMLWPDNDDVRSRAALRRALATLNETPIGQWIDADRDTIELRQDAGLSIDVAEFEQLAILSDIESLARAVDLYTGDFMAGFSLRDSAAFDDWQSLQAQAFQHKLIAALDHLSATYLHRQAYEQAIGALRRWLMADPLHETAHFRLIQAYSTTSQRNAALAQYEAYTTLLDAELGVAPQPETRQLYEAIKANTLPENAPVVRINGTLPPLPPLVIGREIILAELKRRLLNGGAGQAQVIIQGWPGIGKTTLSSVLAHDPDIHAAFPDGVLWTSLGQEPNLLAVLVNWGRSLGFHELAAVEKLEEASARLIALLKDRRVLLIVDDVWTIEYMPPLQVGGKQSALLATTRLNDVAFALAPVPSAVLKVPILPEVESIRLLAALAPQVVEQHPDAAVALARDLEGLPLALQVAGRLLHAEMAFGWGIDDLVNDLREGARLLAAQAPANRSELVTETTPSVAALLQRSVSRLPAELQERFALLGVFAPRPATFTLDAIAAVWDSADVRGPVRVLVDRGLLEPVGQGRFQMHALLVMLARSLFEGHA